MELSTTNGHLTIDYLFIYQPHLFSSGGAFRPLHSITGSHKANNLFLHEVKTGFQMDFFFCVEDVILVLKICACLHGRTFLVDLLFIYK